MILLLLLGLAVPLSLGQGAIRILYGKSLTDFGWEDRFPAGLCVWIGAWEIGHLAGVFLGWSLGRCAWLGAILTGGGAAAVLAWELFSHLRRGRRPMERRKREREKLRRKIETGSWTSLEQGLAIVCGISILLQGILLLTGQWADRTGDITLETVRTFLKTNGIYTLNPLTGNAYEAGVPLRIRILSLPTVYGGLCRLTGSDPSFLVCGFVPVLVLVASYCAYYGLGVTLFGKRGVGKWIFLGVVSLLIWTGDYLQAMDGFQLMHGGWRGTAIRAGVLLPFTLNLCLKKKWKLTVPGVLAEACIVWTFYGAGACLLTAVLLFALQWAAGRKRRVSWREGKAGVPFEKSGGGETSE